MLNIIINALKSTCFNWQTSTGNNIGKEDLVDNTAKESESTEETKESNYLKLQQQAS